MNIKKIKKETWVAMVVLGLIMVWLIATMVSRTNNQGGIKTAVPTKTTTKPIVNEPLLVNGGIYDYGGIVEGFEWLVKPEDLASESVTYEIKAAEIGSMSDKLVELFQFKNPETTLDNIDVLWVKDKDTGAYFYITKGDGRIQYQAASTGNTAGGGLKNEDKIKTSFVDLCRKMITNTKTMKLGEMEFKPVKEYGQRVVAAKKEEATGVEIYVNLYIDNNLVLTSSGMPVFYGQYGADGKIGMFRTQYPMAEYLMGSKQSLMTAGQLQNKKMEDYRVFRIKGTTGWESSFMDGKISKVTVTKNFQGLLTDPKRRILVPYFFVEGNSVISEGPVNVTIGTESVKK